MKKLLLLSALLVASVNYSQVNSGTTTSNPNKIKVYTPSSSSSNGKSNDNGYKWVVKTDLFAAITGEFPLIAEFRIAKKFSFEGSAAVTNAFWPNNLSFSNNGDTFSDENSKAAIGSAFRGTLKYYPSSDYDAIEGWSFGIQLFTKTTNREYENNFGTTPQLSLEGKKDSKTKTGISLIISKQIFEDSNIAFESFIGIGMATISRDYYSLNSNANGLIHNTTSESSPNFQLGFRIGFGN